jgi:hypothetical protein
MQEEVALQVIEFLKKHGIFEFIKNGAKGADFSSLTLQFLEEYPNNDHFDARYAMECLAGRSNILHIQRMAAFRKVSDEYDHSNYRDLRATRAYAVNTEYILQNGKHEILSLYKKLASEELATDPEDEDRLREINRLKYLLREHSDAYKEMSKIAVTTSPIVTATMNRMLKSEDTALPDDKLKELDEFLQSLKADQYGE